MENLRSIDTFIILSQALAAVMADLKLLLRNTIILFISDYFEIMYALPKSKEEYLQPKPYKYYKDE